ncbi:MAG: hypothetical protein CMF58_00585 [Lentimicrobiaceae bacterium]|jgi:hypothetical protein|nr:hypothetical protein [Lentimicrobiaceae bacterium]|tara:strand:+ start:1348 stop:1590 length:243 start_codon:yes stop_codon:yes gene_type:complete
MINNLPLVYSNNAGPIHAGLIIQGIIFRFFNYFEYFNINILNIKELNPYSISHFGDYKPSSFPYRLFKLAKRDIKKIKSN